MKQIKTLLAFASGCAVAAGVGSMISAARAEAAPDPAIHVCVAQDGVLRLAAPSAECPPSQKSLLLRRAEADVDAPKPDKEDAAGPAANAAAIDKDRLADFDRRLKALEDSAGSGALANKVVAPFEVADRAGKLIFSVDRKTTDGVVVAYNSLGKAVAGIVARDSGGYFLGRSVDGERDATCGATATGAGVDVREGPQGIQTRLSLGRDADAGTYRLKFLTKEGAVVASIGQGKKSKAGAALVSDTEGNVRAGMQFGGFEPDKGAVAVSGGRDNNALALLTEGANGGGLLKIYSAGGEAMVEAGVAEGGFGVVRAGPESFKPGYGLLGLPGSYISGKPK